MTPGWGPCWSATTPARTPTCAASTSRCAKVGHQLDPPRPARRHLAGRPRSGHRRAQRRPRLPRLPGAAAAARSPGQGPVLERVDPAKDADGLHPVSLGRLVLGEPGPLPCTPLRHRGPAAPLRDADRRRPGLRGRPWRDGGPPTWPAADPAQRERHRDAVPHRHQGPGRRGDACGHRGRRGRAAGADHRATWSSRARPCWTSVSPAPTTGWSATCTPDVREVAGYLAPMPGGVGPMTIATLLTNTVAARRTEPAGVSGPAQARSGGRRFAAPPPFLLVMAVVAVGMVLIVLYHWRRGYHADRRRAAARRRVAAGAAGRARRAHRGPQAAGGRAGLTAFGVMVLFVSLSTEGGPLR